MHRSIANAAFISLAVLSCDAASKEQKNDAGVARATSGSTARIGSCDRVGALGTCSEYAGTYLAQNEMVITSTCSKVNGTFVYAPCPNTSIVGACTLSTGEVRRFYSGTSSNPYTAPRAKSECETFGGKFEEQR